jgi:ABC-type nitrate/sulfonate/bicarbonate transport system substrate-binding protein
VQYDPAPVANGEVDGQVVFSVNEPTQLELQGFDTNVMLFADFGYDILSDVFFATNETIKKEPEALAAFLKATRAGYQELIDDPDKAAELTVEDYGSGQGFDLDQQKLQARAMRELMLTDNVTTPIALPEDTLAANIATIARLGIDLSVDDLFTTEILDRIAE